MKLVVNVECLSAQFGKPERTGRALHDRRGEEGFTFKAGAAPGWVEAGATDSAGVG